MYGLPQPAAYKMYIWWHKTLGRLQSDPETIRTVPRGAAAPCCKNERTNPSRAMDLVDLSQSHDLFYDYL